MWRLLRNRRLFLRLHRPTIFRALTYWAHRAVIIAITWFPCLMQVQLWGGNGNWRFLKPDFNIIDRKLVWNWQRWRLSTNCHYRQWTSLFANKTERNRQEENMYSSKQGSQMLVRNSRSYLFIFSNGSLLLMYAWLPYKIITQRIFGRSGSVCGLKVVSSCS